MRTRASSWAALAAALVINATSFVAQAQGDAAKPAESVDAKAEFASAIKLYKDGNAADALPIFERVATATNSPNAHLYVGHCLVKQQRYVEAHGAFSAALKAILAQPDEKYEATREAALSQLALLSQRVAKLVVSLTDTPPGLEVRVDGRSLDTAALGTALVLEPGEHRVEAQAQGRQPVTRDVQVQVGEEKTVALALPQNEAGKGAHGSVVAVPLGKHPGTTFKTAGFIAGGVGVLGLGVFAVTGLQAKGVHDELKSACASGCADAAHQSDLQRGKSLQTIANTGLVVGALGVLTGGVLLYLGYSKSAEASPTIGFSTRGVTLGYRARF